MESGLTISMPEAYDQANLFQIGTTRLTFSLEKNDNNNKVIVFDPEPLIFMNWLPQDDLKIKVSYVLYNLLVTVQEHFLIDLGRQWDFWSSIWPKKTSTFSFALWLTKGHK